MTIDFKSATTSRRIVQSIKLQVRNRCQLQNARFYEVPRRPGMLLMFQHPRRSHVAPIVKFLTFKKLSILMRKQLNHN